MRIIPSGKFSKKSLFSFDKSDISRVRRILEDVKTGGNRALTEYCRKFDGVRLDTGLLRVESPVIKSLARRIDDDLRYAVNLARKNIEKFSLSQLRCLRDFSACTSKGVLCSQRIIPIERVGIYVPAGNFPLVSTLIMCAVPAQVAGVREIAVFSPPRYNGDIHPVILQTAYLLGIKEIYRVGGVQAIAAMAYGTETIKPVNKIVGPGNKYVSLAKREVFGQVGIDMIAGPSEVMIIADGSAEPEILASDMIAQAEHDINASSILLTTSESLAKMVVGEIERQVRDNPNREIIKKSLEKNGYVVLCRNTGECIRIANETAPEHLEIIVRNPEKVLTKLVNYGSLFVGRYSAEVFGDYTAGVNHTLPTNGVAKYRAGLSVYDFVKIATQLRINERGYNLLRDATMKLAETEGLSGHYNAVKIRET